MKSCLIGLGLVFVVTLTPAAERWVFEPRSGVSGAPVDGVFHHLDGSGRKHIAVAESLVAVTWEDNRDQAPQVYVALKSPEQSTFATALRASAGREAYEPAITAIDGKRFVLVYEQDEAVFARVVTTAGLAEPTLLGQISASHVSVAAFKDAIYSSWRERQAGKWFVKVAALKVGSGNQLQVESIRSVETTGLQTPVLFPTIAANEEGLVIAWEDRRAGHTRLLISHAATTAEPFSEPLALNEFFSERTEYDRGTGVTRVSLAAFGQDEVLAAWMDKRRGLAGYGIFAALGGADIFGPNEKVHGNEGDLLPHYNPATAGNSAGNFVIAWDDYRNGNLDVWIGTPDSDLEWGKDYAPAVASGSGEQSHPSIHLDDQDNLHLLWIERSHPDAASRLWYSFGRPVTTD